MTKPADRASGRFVLRLDPGLHRALRRAARDAGLSLNEYCIRKLAAPNGNLAAFAGASQAVEKAMTLCGDDLVGVAVYGSWSRGTLVARSDVDLLIAVEPTFGLSRSLYRSWDEDPIEWEGRPAEPHFVHLPAPKVLVAGLWAEVALDAVVLFETGLRLSARLVRIRHDIAAGRIVRKLVHGQPYWTKAA